MRNIKPSETSREFVRLPSKIVHEWNGYLEIFTLPRAKENSRKFCFSEQIFFRKQSFGAPVACAGSSQAPCAY